MKHQHHSSTIDHSDYDPIKRVLSIKFHSGDTVYQYHAAGGYHAGNITGKYKFTKR